MVEKFNCKKCGKDIDGHNKYLHDGMCDDCFFEKYFPKDDKVFKNNFDKAD